MVETTRLTSIKTYKKNSNENNIYLHVIVASGYCNVSSLSAIKFGKKRILKNNDLSGVYDTGKIKILS